MLKIEWHCYSIGHGVGELFPLQIYGTMGRMVKLIDTYSLEKNNSQMVEDA